MKFSRNLYIAKEKLIHEEKLTPLNYTTWINFIESHEQFIWAENTESGKYTLRNLGEVPDDFKERVLSSYNKARCYLDFDNKKNHYNISLTFNADEKNISISLERNAKKAELILLKKMADDLNAFLLVDGRRVVNDEDLID